MHAGRAGKDGILTEIPGRVKNFTGKSLANWRFPMQTGPTIAPLGRQSLIPNPLFGWPPAFLAILWPDRNPLRLPGQKLNTGGGGRRNNARTVNLPRFVELEMPCAVDRPWIDCPRADPSAAPPVLVAPWAGVLVCPAASVGGPRFRGGSRGDVAGFGVSVAVDERLGLVVTCWHVGEDAAGPIVVPFPDGFCSAATVVRTDREWDLAALAIHRPAVQPVPISAQAPRPDEMLVLAGYGGNGDYRAVAGRGTQYLAPEKNWPMELVELDAPACRATRAVPTFNGCGELAGVLSGSGFGQTCGSYCGTVRRVRLRAADADFRRLSSQEMLAQQRRDAPPRPCGGLAGQLPARRPLPAHQAPRPTPAPPNPTTALAAASLSHRQALAPASVAARPARGIPTASMSPLPRWSCPLPPNRLRQS